MHALPLDTTWHCLYKCNGCLKLSLIVVFSLQNSDECSAPKKVDTATLRSHCPGTPTFPIFPTSNSSTSSSGTSRYVKAPTKRSIFMVCTSNTFYKYIYLKFNYNLCLLYYSVILNEYTSTYFTSAHNLNWCIICFISFLVIFF